MNIKYHNPSDNILLETSNTYDAIKLLNDAIIKLILVVDIDNKLVGTITDGDIRRSLIQSNDLNIASTVIMNAEPRFVKKSNESDLDSMISKYNLPVILTDNESRVLNICTYETEDIVEKHTNLTLIMAGGRGERLMPLTSNTPKPMLPVNNKPIIHRIIDNSKSHGFTNISISVNYKSEQLIDFFKDGNDFGVAINYIHENEPLGTAGALSLLNFKNLNEPVIVINGDILTSVNLSQLLDFHNNSGKDITMCAANYNVAVPYGTIQVDGTTITDIIEKPLKSYLINAGIYVINPNIIKKMQPNVKIDMTTLIGQYVSDRNVSIYPLHESWIDIGSPEDYEKAQK